MTQYAPEYTKQEKINFLCKHLLWLVPLVCIGEFWFFDWLHAYASRANCEQYGEYTGVHVLMYALFVGMPISFAIVVMLTEGKRSLKVLRLGQNPLPDEKVFKKTAYKYGMPAKVQPIVVFCCIAAFIAIAVWGVFQAEKMTQDIAPCVEQVETTS